VEYYLKGNQIKEEEYLKVQSGQINALY